MKGSCRLTLRVRPSASPGYPQWVLNHSRWRGAQDEPQIAAAPPPDLRQVRAAIEEHGVAGAVYGEARDARAAAALLAGEPEQPHGPAAVPADDPFREAARHGACPPLQEGQPARTSNSGSRQPEYPGTGQDEIDRAVMTVLARRALMTARPLIAAAGATATARCASSGAQLSWAVPTWLFPARSLRARMIRRVAPVRRFRTTIRITRPQSELAVQATIRPSGLNAMLGVLIPARRGRPPRAGTRHSTGSTNPVAGQSLRA